MEYVADIIFHLFVQGTYSHVVYETRKRRFKEIEQSDHPSFRYPNYERFG